jgi:D-tyrosyl-tRNA(Tyr) deacylase
MNLSIRDALTEPEILAVSNFTVYGDAEKSRRPSFLESAGFDFGRAGFELFVSELAKSGVQTKQGVFGADMQVSLVNDGPVTLVLNVMPKEKR